MLVRGLSSALYRKNIFGVFFTIAITAVKGKFHILVTSDSNCCYFSSFHILLNQLLYPHFVGVLFLSFHITFFILLSCHILYTTFFQAFIVMYFFLLASFQRLILLLLVAVSKAFQQFLRYFLYRIFQFLYAFLSIFIQLN